MQSKNNRGFTLIELLVVIAIIGLLSSVVLASLNSARAKAGDAKIRSDLHQISIALRLYYDAHGTMPTNPTPCCGYPSTQSDWLQVLVTEGYLAAKPIPPNASYPYYYYDYGAGSIGALLVANFSGTPASTGYAGSCRPWGSGQNWCDISSNTYYCICNSY